MSGPRGRLVEQIRHSGVKLSPELIAAFARVPREAFVPEGFQRRDGSWVLPADKDFLATVYTDDVLVTKMDGRVPTSSSSQPSLMALMIMALDVHPGERVLEIGAGTGYNAALLAALGAEVVSIDVQEDVANRARSALARAGISGVRVEQGDGYDGFPPVRFDRVIVTVGVTGISPRWLAQLTPEGLVIAPVEHAGFHPVLAVRARGDRVVASVVSPSGFMVAAGPLTAGHPGSFPAPAAADSMVELVDYTGPRFAGPLDGSAYRDLWYAAGVWHRRAAHAAIPPHEQSCLMLLDEPRTGGAAILPDGTVLAGGDEATEYATDAVAILDRWLAEGRPPMTAWRVGLTLSGDRHAPIWVPTDWELPR
ncbi:methyltransferase domain-containing protein [Actinoplanes sp. TBRC 11911]|uniref:protein-L-isoaspartate O-methyltransferase family protein n=1 Tax=Actinoplanes sp. TBRC 11911 TaxID=2729386 RepID=UPI0028A212DC|nr:methyltransferase domain-containing protein [Actinoplanes sp. TBRC 11911]